MTSATRPTVGLETLTLRLAMVVLGITAVVGAYGTTVIVGGSEELLSPEQLWIAVGAAITPPAIAGAVAPWASRRLLRWMALAVVIEYCILLAVLLALAANDLLPGGEVPWFFTLPATPVAAAMIAGGVGAAWVALGMTIAVVQVARVLVGTELLRVVASDVLASLAAVAVVLLFHALLTAARAYDRSAAAALSAGVERAAEEARARASEQFEALVHDELLSTLALAAQHPSERRAELAAEASRARRLLEDLVGPDSSDPVPTEALIDRLRALVGVTPRATLEIEDADDGRPSIQSVDADAAAAICGAVGQALANAVAHAGASAIDVTVVLRGGGLEVRVADDGRGFDPASVPRARMGIATSILGRMRAMRGGEATIVSMPGMGTTVTVAWWAPDGIASTSSTESSRSRGAPTVGPESGILTVDDPVLLRGMRIALGPCLLALAALAALAASRTDRPAIAFAAWSMIALALAAMGWSSLARPDRWRTAIVGALAIAVAGLTWIPVHREPEYFGDTWYVAALSMLLIVLAARGRPLVAGIVGAASAAIALIGGALSGNDLADLVAASVRLCNILFIGEVFVLGTARIQRRTARLRDRLLSDARADAARDAERQELRRRSRSVEALIGNTLGLLAGSEPLGDDDRAECAALEGRLRDQYRAGRLAREPLIGSAMRARRRGVDVVLLDDPGRAVAEPEFDDAVRWIAGRLDAIDGGGFTGRILPEGHVALASAVTEDEAAQFLPGGRAG